MKFKNKRKIIKLRETINSIFKTIIGTLLMAFATDLFLLPNQLSVGGFTGIGTIIHYYLFEVPIGTIVLALNIPLFIFALIKNGKKFFLDSIIGTISLSLFLNVFQNMKIATRSGFLACIYGGVLSGIGTSLVLKANASTRWDRSISTNSKSV